MRAGNPLDREILTLALPALGALAADPLVSMVDTAFVGRRAVGRGDVGRAGRLAVDALMLAGVAGVVALALIQVFAGPILSVMGADDFRFLARQMLASAVAAAAVLLLVVPMGWGLTGTGGGDWRERPAARPGSVRRPHGWPWPRCRPIFRSPPADCRQT